MAEVRDLEQIWAEFISPASASVPAVIQRREAWSSQTWIHCFCPKEPSGPMSSPRFWSGLIQQRVSPPVLRSIRAQPPVEVSAAFRLFLSP